MENRISTALKSHNSILLLFKGNVCGKRIVNIEFLVLFVIGSIEFLVLFYGDLPPGYSYSIFPHAFAYSQDISIYNDAWMENNFSLLLLPTVFLPNSYQAVLSLYLTFIIGFTSIFYYIKYVALRYTSVENINLLRFSSLIVSSLYVNTFYFSGGTFFNYSLYYSFLPLILMAMEKYFNTNFSTNRELLKGSILVTLVMSMAVLDIRTIVYNVFIFGYFFIFTAVKRHSLKAVEKLLISTLLVSVFYIILNIRFMYIVFLEKAAGAKIVQSVVPAQIYIALGQYKVLFALTGSETWFTVYNPMYVYLGLIPIIVGVFTFGRKSLRKSAIFLLIPIIVMVVYSTMGGRTILFYIAQTSLYPYLVIIYPYFVMGALYDPFLYMFFGLGLFVLLDSIYSFTQTSHIITGKGRFKFFPHSVKNIYIPKLSKGISIFLVFLVVMAVILPTIFYLSPQISATNAGEKTVGIPASVNSVVSHIYSSNLSGNIFLTGALSNGDDYLAQIPNLVWSNYPASPANVLNFIISTDTPNLGLAMSYFGVQYMIYSYNGNYSELKYFNNQSALLCVDKSANLYLFENLAYYPQKEFNNSLYLGFDMPYLIKYISQANYSLPVVPFYSIDNISSIIPMVTGIAGNDVTPLTLIPVIANNSDSYEINVGSIVKNDYPNGWGIAPINGIGSDINALYPYAKSILNISIEIPKGEYYTFTEGGSFRYGYGSSSSSLEIASGNNSNLALFNQSLFAPYIEYNFSGILNITTSYIHLVPQDGSPFVSKIIFISTADFTSLFEAANFFYLSHPIYSFSKKGNNISKIAPLLTESNPNINYTTSLIFINDLSPSGAYFQPLKISSQLYHFTYDYGLGNVYITTKTNFSISIPSSNGIFLPLTTVFLAMPVAMDTMPMPP